MEKKDKNVYVLMDTRDYPTYEDYVDYCEVNDCEPQGEDSNDYWEYVAECQQIWQEDELSNMDYSKDGKCPCLITGELGLWNGRPTIYPTRAESMSKAVMRCARSGDDFKVTFNHGVIEVDVMHHDGTNHFEIRKLSKRGIKVTDNWTSDAVQCEVKPYWLAKFKGIF